MLRVHGSVSAAIRNDRFSFIVAWMVLPAVGLSWYPSQKRSSVVHQAADLVRLSLESFLHSTLRHLVRTTLREG